MSKSKDRDKDKIFDLFDLFSEAEELELEDVNIEAEELAIEFLPLVVQTMAKAAPEAAVALKRVIELKMEKFELPVMTYPGSIPEVKIGATKAEGGTRGKVIKVGGETCPPYYRFESPPKNRPIIALDVFDQPIVPLAGPVKASYKDVLDDPAEWAKKAIQVYGADLISLHLVSTDPTLKDTSVQEAAKTVERVLQAIDEPIIIGGSGNPQKDLQIFQYIGEITAGERLVFASATIDMDLEAVAKAMSKTKHNVVALAFMDINQAKELSRKLIGSGLPKDHLIIDPTTGALGYGIEYSFSVMERIRLSGLMGDESLQAPISCAATNAWAAREAWMKVDEWGPREYRGPLWEATTAIVGLLAGADMFMMMHPLAAKIVKGLAEILSKPKLDTKLEEINYSDWVKMKV
ncbi:MAG: CO dehydrogenase/acetyl-CoA synthase subunit delta [Candidatus Nezhaarchaeota archaeon]|nr:CO dehydrogenase/acetyl-CoA synthase subunit delta [Candidatus Nezhaarchaeota archaeon]MCX8142338.1 CO dehydrogenase/acetyl-CoA synthase subunit delta [Candidatus Nezhaarchaeota archaeon]MDW8050689.1 CO dehydrogenase/acetyl-CoA synthase subunit delta [Nitrososphaerota archaeon]